MLKSPTAAEKIKAKNVAPGFISSPMGSSKKKAGNDSDGEDAPATKKKKVELVFEDELKAKEEGSASNGSNSLKVISK